MSDSFLNVGSARPVYVNATPADRIKITNLGDGTLYYGGANVTSGSNDGSIAANDNETFSDGVYVIAATGGTGLHIEPYVVTNERLELVSEEYSESGSRQQVAADFNVAAGAGTSEEGDTSFLAAGMFNTLGDTLTKEHNYLGGVIAHYNLAGTKASTYPSGAVLGGIGDGVTEADGAFVAYIDGDSAQTNAEAAFKVMHNNSTPGSGFAYGLDLQDDAHDDYDAVAFTTAPIRLGNDIVIAASATAPVNGTTLDNVAGKGSLVVALDTGVWYSNTGTITDSTWTVVGAQS